MASTGTGGGRQIVLEAGIYQTLAGRLRGELILPDMPGYHESRALWNGMIDRRPAAIVRCAGVADVIDTVNLARENDLLLAVRGGGHNVAGHAVCDGGMVIDLSPMRSVWLDLHRGTVRVEGGAIWRDVDRETQEFGLAAPGGLVSDTGVAGLTLGGGLGWLRRKVGLSCDSLVSMDVVTADGRLLTASEDEHADLFWALRGGGGNFGVVTSFEFRVHPVGPTVMFTAAYYPEAQAARVLRGMRDYCSTAPDEVSVLASIWAIPSSAEYPRELHGVRGMLVGGCHAGPPAEGEEIMRPLLDLGEPLLDLSGQISYVTLQQAFDEDYPAGQMYYWKSLYLNDLNDTMIDRIVDEAASRTSPLSNVDIWHMGGAIARVGVEETAFAYRNADYMLAIESNWTDRSEADRHIAWTRQMWDNLQPYTTGVAYTNFGGFSEESQALVRTAFGPNYERLVEVKTRYDPGNLFRMNQNIRPAG